MYSDGQPKPNLFFGAVQHIAKQKEHELHDVYRDTTNEHSFTLLQQFCAQYRDELRHVLTTKRVQTNEVQRAAYLYPVFSTIAAREQKPLALLEIGTSAGLLLHVDKYCYELLQGAQTLLGGQLDSKLNFAFKKRW